MTSPAHLLAHVHVMKTAGQTVCDILRQSFPGNHCDLQASPIARAADLRLARRFYPRLKSIAGQGVVPLSDLAEGCDSIHFFAFLRDPVQRCVSHYQFSRQKGKTRADFETWLAKRANYQTHFLSRTGDAEDPWAIVADADRAIEIIESHLGFVGLMERFNESLVLLRRWSREPGLDIYYRSRNIAPDNQIKKELLADPRTVAMIRAHHEADEKLYRYVREVVYPRQVQQYGPSLAGDVAELEAGLPATAKRRAARTLACAKRNLLYKPFARRLARQAA